VTPEPCRECDENAGLNFVIAARDALDMVLWAEPSMTPLAGVEAAIQVLTTAANHFRWAAEP
jgi:hypothetical protein